MKNVLFLLKRNAHARAFLFFNLIFYTSMWISKTVHPLWFNENHALHLFGISYTMMAIAGALAVVTGFLGEKFGTKNTLRIGIFAYSLGLLLRIFTDSFFIAAASGFIAGIGASLVFVCLKPWIVNLGTQEEKPAVVALNSMGATFGTSLGTLLAGIAASSLGYMGKTVLPLILISGAVICFISIFFVPNFDIDSKKDVLISGARRQRDLFVSIRRNPIFMGGILFFGILSGVVVSFLTPYLPLILHNFDFSIAAVGIIIAMSTALRALTSPFTGAQYVEKYKTLVFFASEGILGITTVLLAIGMHQWIIVGIFLIRSVMLNFSVSTEQLIELSIFPKESMSFCFGLLQSAFFVGDAFGGSLAGFIYVLGVKKVLLTAGGLTMLNAILFPLFSLYLHKFINRGIENGAAM